MDFVSGQNRVGPWIPVYLVGDYRVHEFKQISIVDPLNTNRLTFCQSGCSLSVTFRFHAVWEWLCYSNPTFSFKNRSDRQNYIE